MNTDRNGGFAGVRVNRWEAQVVRSDGAGRSRHDGPFLPQREYLFSPNGAMLYQPRAERSVALGWTAKRKPALKGRPMGGAARENWSPLQGFGPSPTPTQGDALGWNGSAPLGLNTCRREEHETEVVVRTARTDTQLDVRYSFFVASPFHPSFPR